MKWVQMILINMSIILSSLFSQINTEVMRGEQGNPGIHQKMNLSYTYISANSKILIFNGSYHLNYNSQSNWQGLFIMKYNRAFEKSKEDFTNTGFSHLRFTRLFQSKIYIESFLQKEFNYFIDLKNRELIGGGFRFNPYENLFIGIGLMNEKEVYQDRGMKKSFMKSTNYINYSVNILENLTIQNIMYYQFKLEKTAHYRILWDGNLSFQGTDWLSFYINCHYQYNISEIKNSYFEVTNGLGFNF